MDTKALEQVWRESMEGAEKAIAAVTRDDANASDKEVEQLVRSLTRVVGTLGLALVSIAGNLEKLAAKG